MQNWESWICVLVPSAIAIIALIKTFLDSSRIKSIEEEMGDLDIDVIWREPDPQGNVTCDMIASGDSLQDVVISLPCETRKIGLLEKNTPKSEQFQGLAYGTPYTISFKDPARGKGYKKREVIRLRTLESWKGDYKKKLHE